MLGNKGKPETARDRGLERIPAAKDRVYFQLRSEVEPIPGKQGLDHISDGAAAALLYDQGFLRDERQRHGAFFASR